MKSKSKAIGNLPEERKQLIISLIICLIYMVFHAFIAMRHEAWRDEAQAWVLAKNLSFSELFDVLSIEGHPILWFIICRFFSKLGLSFYFFSLISILIMGASVFVLLYYVRIKPIAKIILLFSPVFLYYNPIICRVYAVVVLLLTVLAVFWRDREKHYIRYAVTVLLLSQTHILVSGVALGCLAETAVRLFRCKDKKKRIECAISLMIIAVGVLLLFLELHQSKDNNSFINVSLSTILYSARIANIKTGIESLLRWYIEDDLFLSVFTVGFVVVGFALLGYVVCRLKKSMYEVIVALFAMGTYMGIICLVRKAGHIQLAIVFFIITYFITIIFSPEKHDDPNEVRTDRYPLLTKVVCLVLCIIAVATIPKTVSDTCYDIKKEFSGSRLFAQEMEEYIEDESVVVLTDSAYSPAIYAYLYSSSKGLYFYDINNQEEYRGHIWRRELINDLESDELINISRQAFPNCENVYFVSNEPFALENPVLSNTDENYWNEFYYLYRID